MIAGGFANTGALCAIPLCGTRTDAVPASSHLALVGRERSFAVRRAPGRGRSSRRKGARIRSDPLRAHKFSPAAMQVQKAPAADPDAPPPVDQSAVSFESAHPITVVPCGKFSQFFTFVRRSFFGLFSGSVSAEQDAAEEENDLSALRYKPESLETLQSSTKFSKRELQLMYRGFKQECPSGMVSEEQFKKIYGHFFPQGNSDLYAQFVFHTFDTEHAGVISFEEFVVGLSTIIRGSYEEKLRWVFTLYDVNQDGVVTKDDLYRIIFSVYELMGKAVYPGIDQNTPADHVESIFDKIDKDKDGVFSWEDFLQFCIEEPWIAESMNHLDTYL